MFDLPPAASQARSIDVVLDSALLAGYQWRNIGPDRGGRSIAASGVVGQPDVAYLGAPAVAGISALLEGLGGAGP